MIILSQINLTILFLINVYFLSRKRKNKGDTNILFLSKTGEIQLTNIHSDKWERMFGIISVWIEIRTKESSKILTFEKLEPEHFAWRKT